MALRSNVADDERIAAALAKVSEGIEELRRLNYEPSDDHPPYSCSFCGRANTEVERIIAGAGPTICDICIERCSALLAELRSDGKAI
jgi:hypothetical protein